MYSPAIEKKKHLQLQSHAYTFRPLFLGQFPLSIQQALKSVFPDHYKNKNGFLLTCR